MKNEALKIRCSGIRYTISKRKLKFQPNLHKVCVPLDVEMEAKVREGEIVVNN